MRAREVPRGSLLAPRLALAYSAIFLWMGLYLPYWPVWLEHQGMSPSQVGILLAVAPWTRALASPVAGRWADRSGRSHRLVQVLCVLMLLLVGVFTWAEGFWLLLLLMIVLGLVFSPVVPLVDGITVGAEAEGHLSYGPVRLWGSLAFILASWTGGELLERSGAGSVPWLLLGVAGLLVLASFVLPTSPAAPRDRDEPSAEFSAWSRPFVTVLVLAGLIYLSHGVLYGFGTVHWLRAGLEEGTVGLLWAEGVIAEILLFALAPRLGSRARPWLLWMAAGIGGVVRWSILASTTALPWLVLGQALHGLTFGALHLGTMAYLRLNVPAEAHARATTVLSAVSTGVALGVGLPLGGVLYGELSGSAYWAMTGAAALGLAITIARRRDLQAQP